MIGLKKLSYRNFDWYLLISVLLLVAIGTMSIYSVDLSRGVGLVYFKKQLVFSIIGFCLLFAASFTHYNLWRNSSKAFYIFAILLLVSVLFFGQLVRGTRSWFTFFGYSFQPVELAKVSLILIMAYIISRFGRRFERPLFFYGTGMIAFIPIFLVLIQPDLGSAVLLGAIWFGLMLLIKAKRLHILSVILVVVLIGIVGWFFLLKGYQKDRLAVFVDPQKDPLGSGYNVTQSIIAVGAGQVVGRGLGFGSQSQLHFLPEAQTDFIFSVIGEELGFVGVLSMLSLFLILFWRIIVLIQKTDNDFSALVASGALILFFAQFVTNIGASIGLLPITGVTLPFVSYGGSSLIINLFLVGILESMVENRIG